MKEFNIKFVMKTILLFSNSILHVIKQRTFQIVQQKKVKKRKLIFTNSDM